MSTPMIEMDHFKRPDGGWDFSAYQKAQTANGERCYRCDGFIVFHKGHRELCYDCKSLDSRKGESILHDSLLRCPACLHQFQAYTDCDDGKILGDGEHNVNCPECEHDFQISTHVSYSFESPAVNPKTEAAA